MIISVHREYRLEQEWAEYKKSVVQEIVGTPKQRLVKSLGHIPDVVRQRRDSLTLYKQ